MPVGLLKLKASNWNADADNLKARINGRDTNGHISTITVCEVGLRNAVPLNGFCKIERFSVLYIRDWSILQCGHDIMALFLINISDETPGGALLTSLNNSYHSEL